MRAVPVVGLLVLACACGGCGRAGESGPERLGVVATTTQVGDLVRVVGGRRVDLHQILRPNSDPHGYEPRPSDARAVGEARVVFRSGGELDRWLGDLIEGAGAPADVVELLDSVRALRSGGRADPHWWQDPRNAVLAVERIRDALIERDPAGRALYTRNARAYVAKLRRLDHRIAACVEKVPAARRGLVTTHDSLGYLAKRYDIRIVGAIIPSLSTQAQPSVGDVDRLVRELRSQRVRVVFAESALSPKLERAVGREAGVRVGPALWADALGPEGSTGQTYLEAMAFNARAIVSGMSGGSVGCRLGV